MTRRGVALSLVVFVCTAAAARPEAVAIDHKAVGCIVVGKYPKMNACFSPAAELARSRVYFRPEGVPSWYYVDMKSDQPCFTGTLPRPGKKLVGKKIEYYVEAQNKAFEPARTAEFDPIVVKSAQECKKNAPVAPFLNNATVAVFPALPAGFVGGGIGTAAIIGIAGAGAAAAGTAAVVASNNNDTTTTTPVVVVSSTTTTTTLATTTTTTTLPTKNGAPFAVLTTNPDPPSGAGPLTVTFDLCKSTDPDKDPLSFFFDFGDGAKASGSCNASHTYQSTFQAASNVHALDRSYTAQACVVDPGNLAACRTRNVVALCPSPTVDLSSPPTPVSGCPPKLPLEATTSGATRVTFCAEPTSPLNCGGARIVFPPIDVLLPSPPPPPPTVCGSGSRSGDTFTTTLTLSNSGACYKVTAQATSVCGSVTSAPSYVSDFGCPSFSEVAAGQERLSGWSSDLSVEGGRLQVIVNGAAPAFPERGRAFGTASLVNGENRVEAVLVESAGKAGLWRVDLSPAESVVEGSLRVISGEAVLLGASSATFRLSGREGERIVFTFLKK
jgi:hypothetical protein